MNERRRSGDFTERLSVILVIGALLGGYFVILDVKLALTGWGQSIQVGGEGFSPEVKGVVIQSMLITALAAVVAFWFGTTKQGQDQAQSVNKIAEASAPTTAMAVAASRSDPVAPQPVAPVTAENMQVDAATVNVTTNEEPKK